jgi:hypothetical protein
VRLEPVSFVLVIPEAVVGALAIAEEAVVAPKRSCGLAVIDRNETEDPRVRGLDGARRPIGLLTDIDCELHGRLSFAPFGPLHRTVSRVYRSNRLFDRI